MSTMDLADDVARKELSIRQVLRVRIQDAQCVIDLALVERVISIVALKPVPGAPSHLVGLLDYHGESIPIVDLGVWLGQADNNPYRSYALTISSKF